MTGRKNCKHRKNEDNKKCGRFDKLYTKKLCAKNIRTQTIIGNSASFENLSTTNAQITNLVVGTINGLSIGCPSVINTSGVITPVVYDSNGPIQPANSNNFNQSVLNDLWSFTLLAGGVTNADADSGRLRNAILNNFYNCPVCPSTDLFDCPCPNNIYSMFIGSITNNILTVTSMLPNTLTPCTPSIGPIQLGQMIFGQSQKFLSSVIVSQLTGVSGGIGTYEIQNEFNDYSQLVPSQTMLSLNDLSTITCVNVPLRIYGVETISVTGTECKNIISAIAYNLNIANKTLETRIAAVYVQVGWQVPSTNITEIQGIEIDTKQFDPSILSFGEQMNGNVLLPTDLINRISAYNTLNTINAVVQLVVYVEDGAQVLIPSQSSSGSLSRNALNVNDNVSRNYSISYVVSSCNQDFLIPSKSNPFVQPNEGETVVITFEPIYATLVMNVPSGGIYILDDIRNNTYLNPGINSVPPGTLVPASSNVIGLYTYIDTSNLDVSFIAPAVGETAELKMNYNDQCEIINKNVIMIALGVEPSESYVEKYVGYYNVVSILPGTEQSGDIFTLRNNGGTSGGFPPGTIITARLFQLFVVF